MKTKNTTHPWMFALMALMTASSLYAKDRAWETGTVEESRSVTEHLGGGGPVAIAQSSSGGSSNPAMDSLGGLAAGASAAAAASRPTRLVWQQMTIRGGKYIFKVSYLLRWHRPTVTIHGPIKYAVEKGGKLYLQDEDGKEFKMQIVEKELIPAPNPQNPKL